MTASAPTVVAIFNSSDDLVELLRIALEERGFVAVTAHINDVRNGKLDLKAFVEQHRPSVVVYDLIPPYDRHWAFVDHLRTTSPLTNIPFVITSTNARMARELAARTECVIEVLGRPFDLEEIVSAVQKATAD